MKLFWDRKWDKFHRDGQLVPNREYDYARMELCWLKGFFSFVVFFFKLIVSSFLHTSLMFLLQKEDNTDTLSEYMSPFLESKRVPFFIFSPNFICYQNKSGALYLEKEWERWKRGLSSQLWGRKGKAGSEKKLSLQAHPPLSFPFQCLIFHSSFSLLQ